MRRPVIATSLDAMLSLEGEEFVLCCFLVLLSREPGDAEMEHNLRALGRGRPKKRLIAKLAASAEGRIVDAAMPGLKRLVKRYRQSRLPLVGWLFRVIQTIPSRRKPMPRPGRVIRLSPQAMDVLGLLEGEAESYRSRKADA